MPAVTRICDDDEPHCGGMVRAKGSGNVFANGIAISRQRILTQHIVADNLKSNSWPNPSIC